MGKKKKQNQPGGGDVPQQEQAQQRQEKPSGQQQQGGPSGQRQQQGKQQQQQQQKGPQQQGGFQQQSGPQQKQQRSGSRQQQSGDSQQRQQQPGGSQQYQQPRGHSQQQGDRPQQYQQSRGPPQHQQGPPQQYQQQRGPPQQQWGPSQQQQGAPQQYQQPRGPPQQQQGPPQQYQQPKGPPQQQQGPRQQYYQQRGPSQQQWGPPQQQWSPPQQQQSPPQQYQQPRGPPQQQQRPPQQYQQQRGPPQQQWGPPQQQQLGPAQQLDPTQQQSMPPQKVIPEIQQQEELMKSLTVTPTQELGPVPKEAPKGGKGKQQQPSKPDDDKSKKKLPEKLPEKKDDKITPPSDDKLLLDIPRRLKSEKKTGRPIMLETNHFALDISKKLDLVFQYDVSIDPDRPKKMLPLVMETFRQKHYPKRFPAFDGMKNLFAASSLPLVDNEISDTISVMLTDEERQKEYKVTVKFNGKRVDMKPLQNYFRGSADGRHRLPPQDVLQVIDVVLRSCSSLTFISVGRSYFMQPEGQIIKLGDGMEMYYGFYQSAIVGWKPFLNVDVAHKAFPMRLDGINLLMDLLRCSEQDLRQPLRPYDIETVHKFIRTLKVQYIIPTQPNSKRVMRVNGLEDSANRATFSHEGRQMTIDQYFSTVKNYRLRYPHLPCLWVGSQQRTDKILLPIELCTVLEGQPVNRKMTPDQTSAMIRQSATDTDVRKGKIMRAVRDADYNRHPVVREFDISVSTNFEKINGRVLAPPMIGYENRQEKPSRGVWRSQKFYKKSALAEWTILNLDNRTRENALYDFADMLQAEGNKLGMNIPKPQPFVTGIDQRNAMKSIGEKLSKIKCQLIVVVLPEIANYYNYVKQAAELRIGCLTQCVKGRNVFRPKPMTVSNILLKINAKLNGINHTLATRPPCLSRPCMLMGADVTHPSPDSRDIPSVAAVTASHDATAFKYNICWRLQPPKVEIIEDLENIVVEQLKYFYNQNRQIRPERIIFFRDGVSEGQFKFVMNQEVTAIRKACTRMNPDYKPQITFLVVQKRHHTRLFPVNPRDSEDRNKNVPAGTCVDEIITHPTATDFYLVSHASIQGVAKPTKYRLLYDDANMMENELEELSYYLCHLFSRCTRSVSYPAPTYYAHLAAARAKVYIETRKINLNNLQREQDNTQIQDFIIKNAPMFFV